MLDQFSPKQLMELAQFHLSQRAPSAPLTRDEIAVSVDQLLVAFPGLRTHRDAVISQLTTLYSVFIGDESVLRGRDSHHPWLNGRRDSIDWRFWDRYRGSLAKRLPPPVIGALHRVTDRTLDLMGDPEAGPFNRRGMVVGDVQAGKTSNYTGLVCKAADAGYKVIIILSGLHNNLRSQTQVRLDEGFVGKVSVPIGETPNMVVGVGRINPSPVVNWATNRTERGDFNAKIKNHFGVHPGGPPLLFVVKKIKSVLDSILAWINTTGNAHGPNGERRFQGIPLLLIDDEADNASIDTQANGLKDGRPDPDHEPSKINARIRRILGRFDQASYVGYTATPFANIFIHPHAETDNESQDLFPRDFIINIQPPDNYVGPSRVFGFELEDDEVSAPGLPALIECVSDYAESTALRETRGWVPPIHKGDHRPLFDGEDRIPPSLERALDSFALVIAARRARGQGTEHNSMLVHVTRFQAVQRQVTAQVQRYLDVLKDEVRYGGEVERLRKLWHQCFAPTSRKLGLSDCPVTSWDMIAAELKTTTETIWVREINGSSADILNYEDHREAGLNVVAVGGDKLARGLTLEGLSISYFLRGSRMYDTLMQMGRWFGYRPGYLDLCRLFTTPDLVEWYEHITLASEELRREFDRMEAISATPSDFGLRVRSHPLLYITSRAKMRHGTEVRFSFAGDVSETTVFSTEPDVLSSNFNAVNEFITRLGNSFSYVGEPEQAGIEGSVRRRERSHYWSGVPAAYILDLLLHFQTHPDAPRANSQLLAKYFRLQNQVEELTHWNIFLAGGDGAEVVTLGGRMVPAVVRQPKGGYGEEGSRLTLRAGDKFVIRRLLNPPDEGIDIPHSGHDAAMRMTLAAPPKRRKASDSTQPPAKPSEAFLRRQRSPENGLLLLYPLAREARISTTGGSIVHQFLDIPQHVVGLGFSFPGSENAHSVSYVVNSVYGLDDEGDA